MNIFKIPNKNSISLALMVTDEIKQTKLIK